MVYVILFMIGLEAICLNGLQFTVANGAISSLVKMTCGVPQDLCWAPFFSCYMLMILRILYLIKISSFLLMILIYSSELQINLYLILLPMSNLNSWFFANRLSLNLDKTC